MIQSKASRTARRRVIVYAFLLALCLVLLATSNTAPMMQLRDGVNYGLTPIRSALVGLTRSATSVFSTIAEIDRLRNENQSLQVQLDALQAELRQLESVRVQNAQLTELLGIRSSLDLDTVAAEVVGRQISQFERIVVLDRGTDHGITVGDPVLGGGGALVGSIMEAGARSSLALLLSDDRSVVIGLIETSRATGEVRGRLSPILSMANIPSTDTVAVGDRVVTAGLDLGTGVRSPYPRGLLIGRVVDVEAQVGAIVQSALIEPAAPLDKLEYVLVVTDFDPVPLPDPDASPSPSDGASPAASP